ncbi:5'-nucleotidase, lipoprotein e(P4) family [Staphylococcus epidermidis]|uniref:5'-nucleotidase, lipoprotein e(P4) family n=1 Tax=Staphylococcus epidermidis TaxID=1282 RepID=UPI000C18FB4E|nr:5'-nucleotidase, lipoprotein e(P4) family [Staphylococcus epidermidis]AYY61701.1 5'-nucleotidase, lipoprotein e(P4) family [Staphylococcus epidermidis]KAB2226579.1 5'-nucleotidase, lipoprotein e(P4) family [Staphylococcus epidermidis]MBM6158420.1 5'-nucleotidase, lipoprotein e(P4) family [Staphylococcus epidermidis]MBM6161763.1 5'-nucleotidase, lipoprotein e(P4) family [Staphylococcus epidermidis]MBM6169537.1 5'-nucleotidase, lipoprotein e(P4) family [Staphylococcus epidermidis]
MNKLSKYIAIATLASTVTISAPIHTYACESHTNDNHNHTTQHQNDPNLGEQNVMAVSWYQNSAEAKALYLQGYNTAKYQLDEHIKKNKSKKKLAIALDLDETVLDNSPYQGYASMHDTSFPEGWHEWVAAAKAKPVYGAKSFLKYADKKGIDIYYISDRDKEKDFKATKENLKNIGLPQAKDNHILLKGKNDKSKASRRQQVEKNHKLVMLFGDNLLDFTDPKKSTAKEREKLVQKHEKDFGTKYIIFPNPMYGSWESTLYHNNYQISKNEKDTLRKASIKQFNPKTGEVK